MIMEVCTIVEWRHMQSLSEEMFRAYFDDDAARGKQLGRAAESSGGRRTRHQCTSDGIKKNRARVDNKVMAHVVVCVIN
jgi:hypothetical protein